MDFESIRIDSYSEEYIVWVRGGDRTLRLVCRLEACEIVSEPRSEIIYIFRMNGENELRMRKLYTDRDRPEDMEWVFFRKG